VAAAAADVGAEIIAIGTDYVFDGVKGSYVEADPPNPIQVYGRAKLAGEERVREANARHYVVRSAWIFGENGKNFLSQIPGIAAKRKPFRAVGDQRSSPTFAPDLAKALTSLVGSEAYGTYHVINAGSSTHVGFARAVIEILGVAVELDEIEGTDLDRPAPRPRDTSLVGEAWTRAGFVPLPPWRDAVERFAKTDTP
jgi:dTDP-4-dehydrorhamnose reductase